MRVSGKILLFVLILSGFSASRSGATVYQSNGSDASVQSIHDNQARDGDTITLPPGVFTWTRGVTISKDVTLQGASYTYQAGTREAYAVDNTIIFDSYEPAALIKTTGNVRITGITFRAGTANSGNSAILLTSAGLKTRTRLDHCHFDRLARRAIWVGGWLYGVADHNVLRFDGHLQSFYLSTPAYGNRTFGNGSWADFPYYGSDKFFFLETNTFYGDTAAGGNIDPMEGARAVIRYNYFIDSKVSGHGTESGRPRGHRASEVYRNTFEWTQPAPGAQQRSGTSLWHDNQWVSYGPTNGDHTSLAVFRASQRAGTWGFAQGMNPWDYNDPATYGSGIVTEGTTVNGGEATIRVAGQNWQANRFAGYSVCNLNVIYYGTPIGSIIIRNTADTITYIYNAGFPERPITFSAGDSIEIHRVVRALDQNGSGKGDLISATPAWPNQALEPCFSWNNVHLSTGHAYGFGSQSPIQIANRDYYKLGTGFPPDSTPAQVSATYTAARNGVAYVGTFVYPHPLVTAQPGTGQPPPPPSETACSLLQQRLDRLERRNRRLERLGRPHRKLKKRIRRLQRQLQFQHCPDAHVATYCLSSSFV
jgi:ribosome modulation factor